MARRVTGCFGACSMVIGSYLHLLYPPTPHPPLPTPPFPLPTTPHNPANPSQRLDDLRQAPPNPYCPRRPRTKRHLQSRSLRPHPHHPNQRLNRRCNQKRFRPPRQRNRPRIRRKSLQKPIQARRRRNPRPSPLRLLRPPRILRIAFPAPQNCSHRRLSRSPRSSCPRREMDCHCTIRRPDGVQCSGGGTHAR